MAIPNVMNTGRSGMMAAKAAIATTGHNISNANTEGYSRQRVETKTDTPQGYGPKALIGTGTLVSGVNRINDEYIERQIRNGSRDLANLEEKDMVLKQTEDIFNEMNGDGLNRLVSRFFNQFRELSNEPNNEAVRQSVREASAALVNDFHRIRKEVDEVREHIDARVGGYVREMNSIAEQVKDLNFKINQAELSGASANDLKDQRDLALKKLAQYADMSMHTDNHGNYVVEVRGVGPLVVGPITENFSVERAPADDQGKMEGALDVHATSRPHSLVTHRIHGGKLGALLETRDKTLSTLTDRLDELAYNLALAVNDIHSQGVTRDGAKGVSFFKPLERDRAAKFIDLSDAVKASAGNIATAIQSDSPGDNRIAIAISGLQNQKLMGGGKVTMDDWYNSIVSDIGVTASKARSAINQQKDIMNQLGKMREQISGVSIDEETTNLMQFQHAFDASAKVIQVADEMLKTVLDLKR